jgi:hypothetical protein
MSPEQSAGKSGTAQSVGKGIRRAVHALTVLNHERRLAAFAAIGLFLTLFLPWYQDSFVMTGTAKAAPGTQSFTGWGAFSLVEAAVLLVAAGVLTLLFQRAEGHAFHVPGGDGGVILAAGLWTGALIIWRIFDKQGISSQGRIATSTGIDWGIFVALGVAGFMAWTGTRIRAAHEPEPPLPGEPFSGSEDPDVRADWRRSPAGSPADEPIRPPDPGVSEARAGDTSEQLTIPLHGESRGRGGGS